MMDGDIGLIGVSGVTQVKLDGITCAQQPQMTTATEIHDLMMY